MAALDVPYRIRPDEQNPGAWVVERLEALPQRVLTAIAGPGPKHTPKRWQATEWYPTSSAAASDIHEWLTRGRAMIAAWEAMLAAVEPPAQASVEAQGPTVADAVEVLMRKMTRIVDAKLEAFRREQAEDAESQGDRIAKLLIEQWQAVMERFEKGVGP